jgi:hypothetical protein
LRFAEEELKHDREVVVTAAAQDSAALKYASEHIRNELDGLDLQHELEAYARERYERQKEERIFESIPASMDPEEQLNSPLSRTGSQGLLLQGIQEEDLENSGDGDSQHSERDALASIAVPTSRQGKRPSDLGNFVDISRSPSTSQSRCPSDTESDVLSPTMSPKSMMKMKEDKLFASCKVFSEATTVQNGSLKDSLGPAGRAFPKGSAHEENVFDYKGFEMRRGGSAPTLLRPGKMDKTFGLEMRCNNRPSTPTHLRSGRCEGPFGQESCSSPHPAIRGSRPRTAVEDQFRGVSWQSSPMGPRASRTR